MKGSTRTAVVKALMAGTALLAWPALAQQTQHPSIPRVAIDENGIDLLTGRVDLDTPSISAGAGQGLVTYGWNARGSGWTQTDRVSLSISTLTNHAVVLIGRDIFRFIKIGSAYTSTKGDGASLQLVSGKFIFKRRDNTLVEFIHDQFDGANNNYLPTKLNNQDGSSINFQVQSEYYCKQDVPDDPGNCQTLEQAHRISSASYSSGFKVGRLSSLHT